MCEISSVKKCGKCKIEKNFSFFGVDKNRKFGLKSYCNECRKNESDKDKDKIRKKEWYDKNRKLTIERSQIRQNIKRDDRNNFLKKYYKKNSHIYAWRSLVYRTITSKGKMDSTFKLLGYNYNELKEHIELLFTEGMSWDNHGEWHIDHVKPLSLFDNNTPVSIVNALSNLQPLWATTREINGVIYEGNLNKKNKYD